MSGTHEQPTGPPSGPGHRDRIVESLRRYLWLHDFRPKTKSEAYRHSWLFRRGDRHGSGPSLRSFLLIAAVGVVIAIALKVLGLAPV
jgi:hypothetical protein